MSATDTIRRLEAKEEAREGEKSDIDDLWDLIESEDPEIVTSAIDLIATVAMNSPDLLDSYQGELVNLLADTQSVSSGGTVAGHAMKAIEAVAETKPTIVDGDLDLFLSRIIDGGLLSKVYGCRALTHIEELDESSTLAIADVLKRVLIETDNPHVSVAAATAVVTLDCEYPTDRFADPYVQFRANKLDSIILRNDDETCERFYEIMLTAALEDPGMFDHAPKASSLLEHLWRKHSLHLDISKQTYRLAQSRIG